MGLSAGKHDHARVRPDAHRRTDRGKAPPRLSAGPVAGRLTGLFLTFALFVTAATAEPLRLATWAGDFSRKGPGLLLKELVSGDPVPGLATLIAARADVILLTDMDFDAGLAALSALRDALGAAGLDYPHLFSLRPNTGMQTGLDLDGDGRTGGPRDAQGYGWFSGQAGQAVLSRWPVTLLADHSAQLWSEVPDSAIAPDDPAHDVQRLSSTAHWALRVSHPDGPLILLTLSATPPVFDGPEDRNGRRNRDEVLLWRHALAGAFGPPPLGSRVLLGNLNLDPRAGEGRHEAVNAWLGDPLWQDPLAGQPSVAWQNTGPMRVSYILPETALEVHAAGALPPEDGAGPHRMVWVDLLPGGDPGR